MCVRLVNASNEKNNEISHKTQNTFELNNPLNDNHKMYFIIIKTIVSNLKQC